MNQITVTKELLVNLGNFSNIKIIASITTDEKDFDKAWSEINNELASQEMLEKQSRIVPSAKANTPKRPF